MDLERSKLSTAIWIEVSDFLIECFSDSQICMYFVCSVIVVMVVQT